MFGRKKAQPKDEHPQQEEWAQIGEDDVRTRISQIAVIDPDEDMAMMRERVQRMVNVGLRYSASYVASVQDMAEVFGIAYPPQGGGVFAPPTYNSDLIECLYPPQPRVDARLIGKEYR